MSHGIFVLFFSFHYRETDLGQRYIRVFITARNKLVTGNKFN